MNSTPILEEFFYHDGRGPELQRIHWRGAYPIAFDFYNPDDIYEVENLKHLLLLQVEVYAMAGEEVHGNILTKGQTKASIFRIDHSNWIRLFNQNHLANCNHFQVIFYDEIFDIICEGIEGRHGGYNESS